MGWGVRPDEVGHVAEAALSQQLMSFREGTCHVFGGVGVCAHGDQFPAQFAISAQDALVVGGGAGVIFAGVQLDGFAGGDDCLQDLPDDALVGCQGDVLPVPIPHIAQGVGDVPQGVELAPLCQAEHGLEVVVQELMAHGGGGEVGVVVILVLQGGRAVVDGADDQVEPRFRDDLFGGGEILRSVAHFDAESQKDAVAPGGFGLGVGLVGGGQS